MLQKNPDIIQSHQSIRPLALSWPEVLDRLLSKKLISPDACIVTWDTDTLLSFCISEGRDLQDDVYYQSAEILLKHHADPDLTADQAIGSRNKGTPPVIAALMAKKFKLLKLLLQNGANVHAANDKGESLIRLLIKREKDSSGQKLIEELGLTRECQFYRESSPPSLPQGCCIKCTIV